MTPTPGGLGSCLERKASAGPGEPDEAAGRVPSLLVRPTRSQPGSPTSDSHAPPAPAALRKAFRVVLFVSELSLLSRLLMPTFLADVAAAYTPDVRSSLNLGQDRSLLKNPGTRAADCTGTPLSTGTHSITILRRSTLPSGSGGADRRGCAR